MHWTPNRAKTKDVPFTSVLRPIQNPVPGMWLSLSHVNRSFSSWISLSISFLLLPYDRFLSLKLYPSGMKINISASILLDDTASTQTKRMEAWKRNIVLRPLQQRRKTSHKMSEQASRKQPRASKRRLCPLCYLSVWDLPACSPLGNTNSGASDLVQIFWLWLAINKGF